MYTKSVYTECVRCYAQCAGREVTEMPNIEDVGKRIKRLRERQGLTQEELARKAGVRQSAVNNYEAGIRTPKDIIKIRLADALGETVENIFFTESVHERCNHTT